MNKISDEETQEESTLTPWQMDTYSFLKNKYTKTKPTESIATKHANLMQITITG